MLASLDLVVESGPGRALEDVIMKAASAVISAFVVDMRIGRISEDANSGTFEVWTRSRSGRARVGPGSCRARIGPRTRGRVREQGLINCRHQRPFCSAVAEEVVGLQGPDHSAAEALLFQVVDFELQASRIVEAEPVVALDGVRHARRLHPVLCPPRSAFAILERNQFFKLTSNVYFAQIIVHALITLIQ